MELVDRRRRKVHQVQERGRARVGGVMHQIGVGYAGGRFLSEQT